METARVVQMSKKGVGSVKDKKSEVGIRKVRMGTFEDSGLCKGYATFQSN